MDTYYSDQTAVRQHESDMWIIGPEAHTLATDVMAYESREEALAALPADRRALVPVQDLRPGDIISMDGSGPVPSRDEVQRIELDQHAARIYVPWGVVYTSRFMLAELHQAASS